MFIRCLALRIEDARVLHVYPQSLGHWLATSWLPLSGALSVSISSHCFVWAGKLLKWSFLNSNSPLSTAPTDFHTKLYKLIKCAIDGVVSTTIFASSGGASSPASAGGASSPASAGGASSPAPAGGGGTDKPTSSTRSMNRMTSNVDRCPLSLRNLYIARN